MDRFVPRYPLLAALLCLMLVAAAPGTVAAADPQKDALDNLRAKGLYDEAIDYLEHLRANPGTPKSFAQTIDYEIAITRIDAAAGLADAERDKPLQLAQESLAKFLAGQPKHVLSAAARMQLGDVLLDRARIERILAGQYEGAARQEHLKASRELLRQAGEVWAGIDKACDEELKPVFVRGDDIKQSEARDKIHGRQLQARLGEAWAKYETAQTYPAESGERTACLQEAGDRFDAIYDQQRERLAGFYGRLGRGLCWKDLGEGDKAFTIFEELLALPDDPADFHALRGKAAVQAMETSLQTGLKKYKQGLDIAQKWLSGDHPHAESGEVDLAVRYLGGEAALAYAKTLTAASPEQSALRAQEIDWARQQFKIAAATAGPYQAKARLRLLDVALGPTETSEPATFADASSHAKAALDRLLAARAEQNKAARSGTANDVDAQRQRQQQIAAAQSEALKYCRLARDLRTAAVAEEDMDTVRYYLAYLRYTAGELDEAAALGDTVVQNSSDTVAARQAARIGLAAREALFRRATGESRPMAVERLQALAERIIERWGDRSEADESRGVLLDLAVGQGQLDKAEQYLQAMSDASPRRAEAELNFGRALWKQAQSSLRTSTVEHDHTAEAEKAIARAAALLSDGITRCRKAAGSAAGGGTAEGGSAAATPESLSAAMLALAQIHMTEGRPTEAITLLEDPSIAAAAGDYHSLALLAFIATGQLDDAKASLQKLRAGLPPAGSANAARQTLQTCLQIRRLVKQYLSGWQDRRQEKLVQNVVQGLDEFLAAPAPGPNGSSFFDLAWRAEAYAGLADGLSDGLNGASPAALADAEKHFRRGVAIFDEVLHRAAKQADFSPSPEVTIALRIELARCLRRLSEYQEALGQLLDVLQDHPQMVDAQVDAAYIYQAWGEKRPEFLEIAIQGDNRHQEVWGWGELAKRVQSDARFREVFHEARYNLTLCRLHQAELAADTTQGAKLAEAAETDIRFTRQLSPDMGGAVWYDRYNELLKRIQRLAKRPAVGLSAP